MNLYCSFALDFEPTVWDRWGDCEARTLVSVESPLKYHPGLFEVLTLVSES